MAVKVFISYRREDSAPYARLIQDRLKDEFEVFMDVDSIHLGINFVNVLREEVINCDVLIAVIGRGWLDARDDDGTRRLKNPNDFVRIEVATALRRGTPVIPILLEGIKVPKADELPEDLSELPLRSGLEVHHASFDANMDKLIRELKEYAIQADRKAKEWQEVIKADDAELKKFQVELQGFYESVENSLKYVLEINFDQLNKVRTFASRIVEKTTIDTLIKLERVLKDTDKTRLNIAHRKRELESELHVWNIIDLTPQDGRRGGPHDTFGYDTLGCLAVIAIPPIATLFLSYQWWQSLIGGVFVVTAVWQLLAIVYRTPLRRFRRHRLPQILSEMHELRRQYDDHLCELHREFALIDEPRFNKRIFQAPYWNAFDKSNWDTKVDRDWEWYFAFSGSPPGQAERHSSTSKPT
jgi:hypothetical protein